MAFEGERLQLLYELNRRLAAFNDLDDLLQFATAQTRELLRAEGCAILLHDRSTDELYFPISSQRSLFIASADRLREIRFPASQGIAGWALKNGQSVSIPDVTTDERFYRGVDAATGVSTRSVLYAPLRGVGGVHGLVSVINPAVGTGPESLQFLEAIAGDVAVAFDRAAHFSRIRDEAKETRWIGRIAGVCLLVLGVTLVLGTVLASAAVGQPARALLWRPSLYVGAAIGVTGIVLFRAMRARSER